MPLPTSKHLLNYWLPVLLWAVWIFFASTDTFSSEHTAIVLHWIVDRLGGMTPRHFDLLHLIIRKLAHVTEYAVFSVLVYRALQNGKPGWSLRWAVVAVLICAIYASSDEIHQIFVHSRGPSARDVAIDTTGAILAQCGFAVWVRLRRPDEEPSAA